VGTPLDAVEGDPHGIKEIVVEFDEGEEVLTSRINERFGSYDLYEAARYIFFLSDHIVEGDTLTGKKRRGLFHGVEVRRRATDGSGDRRVSEVLIRRICIQYEDGWKVRLFPEAREEFYSQDDAYRVVGILDRGSEVLEWGLGPERDPSTTPYVTGLA